MASKRKEVDDFDDIDVDSDSGDTNLFTWSANSPYEFRLLAYCIKKVLAKIDPNAYEFMAKNHSEFQYDLDKSTTTLDEGSIAFHYKKQNYIWNAFAEGLDHTLESKGNLAPVRKMIDEYIKHHNPLRCKNMQVYEKGGEFECIFKPVPDTKFSDVIMDDVMKEEIYDNTILQIKNLEMNNGIIMYGEQGSGKSMTCQAIINEAVTSGFSTCCVTTAIPFNTFGKFMAKYLSPCVVIFEDIDSFAVSREEAHNPVLADFLQLLSGVSDSNNRTIFIATTNYIDKLDKAVANRPMRFNRKFKFDHASDLQIGLLIDLYFGKGNIPEREKSLCYGVKFTGAHVKELFRTASILSIKNGKLHKDNFRESFDTFRKNFDIKPATRIGF